MKKTDPLVLLLVLSMGVAAALSACTPAPPLEEEDEGTLITGVWAFVSETNTETGELVRDDSTWSGIWVFTNGYHCLARMDNNRTARSAAELAELSPEEQVAHYEQLLNYSGTAGTYQIEGDTLRRQWDVSLGPDIIGLESVARVRVEGDRMFVDLPRRTEESGPAVQVIYRRLE
ncbi:MAG: lipocalin-like domain-containing protein [Acidobacteria bacterium]|nr:lipocalin-like domain-containing protein [Acidobacteriota bacterium]